MRKSAMVIVAFVALAGALVPLARDADAKSRIGQLTGVFFTAGQLRSPGDDPGPEYGEGDGFYYFELSGEAAAAMFERMPVKASPDLCGGEEGVEVKFWNNMECESMGGKAVCYFAIDMDKGAFERSRNC